jgi:hypothetical protein
MLHAAEWPSLSLHQRLPCLLHLHLHVWFIPWGSVPFRCFHFRPIVRGSGLSARYAQGAHSTCLRVCRVLGVYACVYIWDTQACRLLRYICRASKTFLPWCLETVHQLCFRDNPLLSLTCLIGTSLVSELLFVLSCFRPELDSLMLCGVRCVRALRSPPCFP